MGFFVWCCAKRKLMMVIVLCTALVGPLSLFGQNKEDGNKIEIYPNSSLETQGKFRSLAIIGSTLLALSVVLETVNIAFIVETGTDSIYNEIGISTMMHSASATLAGIAATVLLSGIGYRDDSFSKRREWRKAQIIIGSVLSSLGGVAVISGIGILASGSPELQTAGFTTVGVALPVIASGISSIILSTKIRPLDR